MKMIAELNCKQPYYDIHTLGELALFESLTSFRKVFSSVNIVILLNSDPAMVIRVCQI